jgi:hypothetical protein
MKIEWIPPSGKVSDLSYYLNKLHTFNLLTWPLQLAIVVMALFAPTAGLTKISICLTYLRLFPSWTNKRFCYVMLVVLAMWTIATTIVMMAQCM